MSSPLTLSHDKSIQKEVNIESPKRATELTSISDVQSLVMCEFKSTATGKFKHQTDKKK